MKNKQRIKITGYPEIWNGQLGTPQSEEAKRIHLKVILDKLCYLRSARAIGDIETVNHSQIHHLQRHGVKYEKL